MADNVNAIINRILLSIAVDTNMVFIVILIVLGVNMIIGLLMQFNVFHMNHIQTQ